MQAGSTGCSMACTCIVYSAALAKGCTLAVKLAILIAQAVTQAFHDAVKAPGHPYRTAGHAALPQTQLPGCPAAAASMHAQQSHSISETCIPCMLATYNNKLHNINSSNSIIRTSHRCTSSWTPAWHALHDSGPHNGAFIDSILECHDTHVQAPLWNKYCVPRSLILAMDWTHHKLGNLNAHVTV